MNARIAHGRIELLLVAVAVLLAAPTALAQKDAVQATEKKTTAFDAVSIKPSDSASRGRSWGLKFNTYSAKNTPLARVILQAYIEGTPSTDRLREAPQWVMNDYYDITAKVDDKTANGWKSLSQNQQMAMAAPLLRAMLAERCKLVAHTESTEISGYALVVGKHGIKMRLAPPSPTAHYDKITGGGELMFSPPAPDGTQTLAFRQTTIASLTAFFDPTGSRLVDQTGLEEKYDFELPKINMGSPDAAGSSAPIPPPDIAHQFDWDALGLEIKRVKIQVQNLVIDHIEKPSPN